MDGSLQTQPGARREWAFVGAAAAFAVAGSLFLQGAFFSSLLQRWHWLLYPLQPNWTPLLLGAAAAAGLSAHLGRTRPAAGLALASISVALALHLVMGRRFPMQLATLYIVESIDPRIGVRMALADYAAVVESARNPLFLETKPPGRIIAYLLPTRFFGFFLDEPVDRGFAATGFWYLAAHGAGAAVIVLLHRHLRAEHGPRAALLGAGLWAFAPSVLLLDMEFDTRLYPLAALVLWLVFRRERVTAGSALGCGVLFAAVAWTGFSFGLAAVVPVVLLAARARSDWRGAARLGALFAAPIVVQHCLLWVAFGYDPVARMQAALAAHSWAFGLEFLSRRATALFVARSVLELALSAGVLAVAAAWGAFAGRPRADTLAVLAYLAVLPLSGPVIAESARLWASATPFLAILAARMAPSEREARAALAIQIAFVLSLLPNQIFTAGQNI